MAGVLTLAELMSYATQFAGVTLADPSVVSAYVNQAYAMVLYEKGVEHQPREAVAVASTSTSDARLAFPTDYDYALGLKVGIPNSWSTATSRTTTWRVLPKRTGTEFDTVLPNSADSAEPREYAEFSTWFQLRPSPNSAYSIELMYARRPTSNLTASTATPSLDEQWHWAIALKSAELLAGAVTSDMTREMMNAKRYNAYVASLRLDQTKQLMDKRGARMRFARRES